jgi:hypothetical protein
MLAYAQIMEKSGYVPFDGYVFSGRRPHNATYCAKFVRGVADFGGMRFKPFTVTPSDNLNFKGSNVIIIP